PYLTRSFSTPPPTPAPSPLSLHDALPISCSAEPFADRATAASAPRTHSARPPRKPTGLPRTAPGGDPVDLSLHLVALRIVEDPWRDLRLRARALPRSANLG